MIQYNKYYEVRIKYRYANGKQCSKHHQIMNTQEYIIYTKLLPIDLKLNRSVCTA